MRPNQSGIQGLPAPDHEERSSLRQSAAALQFNDALLRLCVVVEATGLSVATIYRKMADGDFPQPIRLGARCSRWRAGDVTQWLKAKAGAA